MCKSYTYFDVFGPYEIPVVKEVAGRYISNGYPDFWKRQELRRHDHCRHPAILCGWKPAVRGNK